MPNVQTDTCQQLLWLAFGYSLWVLCLDDERPFFLFDHATHHSRVDWSSIDTAACAFDAGILAEVMSF